MNEAGNLDNIIMTHEPLPTEDNKGTTAFTYFF